MRLISPKQQQILDFVRKTMERSSSAPSYREIGEHFGIAAPSVLDHLRALARKGQLEILPGIARGIRLVERKDEFRYRDDLLPLIGRVAAGPPVLATDEIDDTFRIDPRLFHPRPAYLRKVVGTSMIDMGIQDGDLIGVHPTPVAENNQIVVAKLFNRGGIELTVKKYRRKGNTIQLLPRNVALAPIVIELKESDDPDVEGDQQIEIEGLYCGHIHPGRRINS
jgi:repressor LexA